MARKHKQSRIFDKRDQRSRFTRKKLKEAGRIRWSTPRPGRHRTTDSSLPQEQFEVTIADPKEEGPRRPMLEKIVSGGQTGADRGALDAAIQWGVPHGGWIPKGRLAEDGPLPPRYRMQEMPTGSYPARTEQNVIDSHGTVIFSHGRLSGGSQYTRKMARKHGRPLLHIDLNRSTEDRAAFLVSSWIRRQKIRTVNVAGPRASQDPQIYGAALRIVEAVIRLRV